MKVTTSGEIFFLRVNLTPVPSPRGEGCVLKRATSH
jgi:hypothetical protein